MSSYYDTSGGQVRLIPGSGTYLENQAKAQSAYQRAKAQLQAQRQQTQIKAGLNKDYAVDPNAQYGGYQQMLQIQGSELSSANEQAQQRGFFGSGLGNQGESALRYGHAVGALGFKNALADYESGYQSQMGDIERQKNAEMLASLQNAADNGQGDWTPPGSDSDYLPDPILFAPNFTMPGLPNMPKLGQRPKGGYFPPKKKRKTSKTGPGAGTRIL